MNLATTNLKQTKTDQNKESYTKINGSISKTFMASKKNSVS